MNGYKILEAIQELQQQRKMAIAGSETMAEIEHITAQFDAKLAKLRAEWSSGIVRLEPSQK